METLERQSRAAVCEQLEARECFSAWGCVAGGVGIYGVEVCANRQGYSATYGAGAPFYGGYTYSQNWNGSNKSSGFEYGVAGGAFVVGSLSNSINYGSNGRVFQTPAGGVGVGFRAGQFGLSGTVKFSTDVPFSTTRIRW
jgi:hypothetical protein